RGRPATARSTSGEAGAPAARHAAGLRAARGIGDREVRVLRMPAHVGVDERADRDDALPTRAGVVQGSDHERRSEAPPLHARIDLGVQERDHVAAALAVDELAHVVAAEQELVAALIRAAYDRELVLRHER